jgi:hypothetical protein
MAGLKVNFVPLTLISSSEINNNFIVIRDWDIKNDDLSAQITGIQLLFTTTYEFYSNSLCVYLDGIRQLLGTDYTVTGNDNFTFTAGNEPLSGQDLVVDYRRSDL